MVAARETERRRKEAGRRNRYLPSETTLLAPTVISKGCCKIFLAAASTVRGNVAENMTVCLSGRIFSMILII